MHKIGGAHVQCVNNHYVNYEYKGMKTVGVTDYTNKTPPKHFGWKKCQSPTALKIRIYLLNVHKMGGAHHQFANNHCSKFEYKVKNTV